MLLLPPVALRRITDAKSLRRPRHIQIAAVLFLEAKIRGVDGNRATAAPAGDSTNPASIDRSRFVMDEGPPATGPSPLAGRSL